MSGEVDSGLSSVVYTLATLRGLFAASEHVSREEFSAYVQFVIVEKQGVSGFSWNQRVAHDERANYEEMMRAEGLENFRIKEKNPDGAFTPAPEHPEYISITYIEPWQENAMILGFNVASDPVRRDALIRARDTGLFAITEPLQLLRDDKRLPGVIVFYPVYRNMTTAQNPTARQESLLGYATAIVRTRDLIGSVLEPFSSGDYDLNITDITEPARPQTFYHANEFQVPEYAQSLIC